MYGNKNFFVSEMADLYTLHPPSSFDGKLMFNKNSNKMRVTQGQNSARNLPAGNYDFTSTKEDKWTINDTEIEHLCLIGPTRTVRVSEFLIGRITFTDGTKLSDLLQGRTTISPAPSLAGTLVIAGEGTSRTYTMHGVHPTQLIGMQTMQQPVAQAVPTAPVQ